MPLVAGLNVPCGQRWSIRHFELADSLVRAAPKEKNMKRTISLWLGLLAFALMPALAQTPTAPKGPTGNIRGHVTLTTGMSASSGTISLSTDGGRTAKFVFPVNAAGDYAGQAAPGTYTVVYRAADTPADKFVDSYDNIKIVAGKDTIQDDDMSRKAYIDNLPADVQKQLEEIKKKNAEILKANEVVKNLNNDLRTSSQDFRDADGAHAAAVQALGAGASRTDIEAKETELKNAKYSEVESLMLRDTKVRPDASALWADLGQAENGLKKYDEAEVAYKKAIDLETASKKTTSQVLGASYSGLGELYARTGKIPEANSSYDSAAKAYPTAAATYYTNEAVIFSNMGNGDAQAAAADQAIKADPKQPFAYYLKGQGLIQKATVDQATGLYVLPAGCAEAYQTYLQLDPNGQFANDAKGILAQAGQKVDTTYKASKPAKSGKPGK